MDKYKKVVQIVDSIDYIRSNCFQHQLRDELNQVCRLTTVPLSRLDGGTCVGADVIVSCLKQRSLLREVQHVANCTSDAPVVVYDQDPWQAFMDDSPYKGAYDVIASKINVKFFALTTKWWVDFIGQRGLPAKFVRMGIKPAYCKLGEPFEKRIPVGFIGTLHPRRKQLVDIVTASNIPVKLSQGFTYGPFLQELSTLGIFIHNEDMPIYVDGKELNFNTGMWVKDIEAIARGCFSIRSKAEGWDTYLSGLETAVLYDDIKDVPDLIRAIQVMDPVERREATIRSVQAVEKANVWHETALALIT